MLSAALGEREWHMGTNITRLILLREGWLEVSHGDSLQHDGFGYNMILAFLSSSSNKLLWHAGKRRHGKITDIF